MNNVDNLINEARIHLEASQSLLEKLLQNSTDDDDGSIEDKILSIQLVLQYRLSCEDALTLLLKIDHNLLYFLGIQPQHSAKINLDRLAYAVGNEDLKQILNVLTILTSSLSKIIARYKNEHASFALRNKRNRSMISREISQLAAKQNQFLGALNKLHLEINQLLEQQAAGPIFDHIAALRGPISQFYQAIVHGLGEAQKLYHIVNKTPLINYELSALLKKADEVLSLMPHLYSLQPNYSLKHFDRQMTSEQLEERAAAKRLRPFFG